MLLMTAKFLFRIEDEEKYDDTDDIYPLLVYMSLPTFAKRIDDRVFYWDYDNDTAQAQVFELHCRTKLLSEILPKVREATNN